jgi:GntR family transcriptional repressor for pyruvate dehydrogenase complex
VDQITRSILTGQMRPGDQIPTETELAEQSGVSRTVVREAIKALSLQGLVHSTPGRGTFISQPPLETVIDNLHLMLSLEDHTFDDLMVVRELLEVPIARLAARHAQPGNIEALATHLQGMRDYAHDQDGFIHHDTAFHAELARATQNVVLTILQQTISKMLRGARVMLVRVPDAANRALAFHEQLYQAVADADPNAAEQDMRDHLAQVAEDIARARQSGLLGDGQAIVRQAQAKETTQIL